MIRGQSHFGLPAPGALRRTRDLLPDDGMAGSAGGVLAGRPGTIAAPAGQLPATLAITVDVRSEPWEPGESRSYGPDAFERDLSWRAWEEPRNARHATYYAIWQELYAMPPDQRESALRELLESAGAERAPRDELRLPPRRLLTRDGALGPAGGFPARVLHPLRAGWTQKPSPRAAARLRWQLGRRRVRQAAVGLATQGAGMRRGITQASRHVP
jgi:hypothetical protein